MIELLWLPEDCIEYKHPIWDAILQVRDRFITKQLFETFVGYANTQIRKAKGLNKKVNWEKDKIERKTVKDFCYVWMNGATIPVRKIEGILGETCLGLSKIPHMKDTYNLYVGEFDGICKEGANDVKLSSIPKGKVPIGILQFHKDAYTVHCKDYKSYVQWVSERNPNRFETNKQHGQNYDSKNISHMVRLLQTAEVIAEKGYPEVRVTGEIKEKLLAIKKGEIDLDLVVTEAEFKKNTLEEKFKESNLPEDVDLDFCHNLVVKIRRDHELKIKR